jgi:hypothetical protein
MQQQIADKLKLGVRSIKNILKDKVLCERILREEVVEMANYAKESKLSLRTLQGLARSGQISAFGNHNFTRGTKMFIFPSELDTYEWWANGNTIWNNIRKTVEIYLSIVPNISQKERQTLLAYTKPISNKDLQRSFGRGKAAVEHIQKVALQKVLSLKYRWPEVKDLQAEKLSLIAEVLAYKQLLSKVQLKVVEKDVVIPDFKLLTSTLLTDLPLSIRAHNCLRKAGVQNLYDLARLTLNDLSKIRNLGQTTIHHLQYILSTHNLEFGMDLPKL